VLSIFKRATANALAEIREELTIRKTKHIVLLFSMGSQFDHLIVIALGRLGIYCLVADPASVTAADVRLLAPSGIIISGGPASEHNEPPPFDRTILDLGIPVLGICLGAQMIAKHLGGTIRPAEKREFSVEPLWVEQHTPSKLIDGSMENTKVQQSHGDIIEFQSSGIKLTARTSHSPVAAFEKDHLCGVQFHPEVSESEKGPAVFANFCTKICGITDRYPAQDVAAQKIEKLRGEVGDADVVLGLSGGTDSSVVAHLIKAAQAGRTGRLYGIYIKGIDRPDDEAHVHAFFGNQDWITVEIIDATDRFLEVLSPQRTWWQKLLRLNKAPTSMKAKRIAMRGVYKAVFEERVWQLRIAGSSKVVVAQGTLYTDLVESGHGHQTGARRAQIKMHHNTGLGFSVPEIAPLDDCVKDTGRDIGRSIGVPEELLVRHPFPGPGQVVRIEGEVTREKLAIGHKADDIYIEELRKWNLYESVWQAGPVVTASRCTCTKGDDAAEGWVIAIWAVWSVNGFTARPARLPYEFLELVADRITNEIREAGAVVYRISGKPPATIEWG